MGGASGAKTEFDARTSLDHSDAPFAVRILVPMFIVMIVVHEGLRHRHRIRDTRRLDDQVLVLTLSRNRLHLYFSPAGDRKSRGQRDGTHFEAKDAMIGNFLDVQASPVADMSRRVNDTSPLNGDGTMQGPHSLQCGVDFGVNNLFTMLTAPGGGQHTLEKNREQSGSNPELRYTVPLAVTHGQINPRHGVTKSLLGHRGSRGDVRQAS